MRVHVSSGFGSYLDQEASWRPLLDFSKELEKAFRLCRLCEVSTFWPPYWIGTDVASPGKND